MFSCEFCEISKNTFSTEHLGTTASGLRLLDYETVVNASTDSLTKKRVSYQKFSPTDRYKIGKWAAEFGTASTLMKFKCSFPNLKEGTVLRIRQKHDEELRLALKQKRYPMKTLNPAPRGRPLMLGKLDKIGAGLT